MEYVKEQLENGLRVIYVPMKGTETATAILYVGAGSRHEQKKVSGLAHFFEHMAFKGTTRRPDKLAISRELDSVGAVHNAMTSFEYTVYWVKADSAHVELSVDILADMVTNPLLPPVEIEKERGVILGELDMYEDDPYQVAAKNLNELMYGDHPIGRDVGGTKESVRAITRDDFIDFRNQYYHGAQSVLVIAGKFKQEECRRAVNKHFLTFPSGEIKLPEPAKEEQSSAMLRRVEKPLEQAHLVFGVRTFPLSDKRQDALDLLSIILGGSSTSRLYVRIREELGLGYYVSSSNSAQTDYGSLDISLGVDVTRLEEAINAVISELILIRDNGINEEELKRAFDYFKGHFRISMERSDRVASYFGSQELLENKILTPDEMFSKLEQITPDDVKRVAQDIFTNERLNLAVVGPVKDEEGIKKILTF